MCVRMCFRGRPCLACVCQQQQPDVSLSLISHLGCILARQMEHCLSSFDFFHKSLCKVFSPLSFFSRPTKRSGTQFDAPQGEWQSPCDNVLVGSFKSLWWKGPAIACLFFWPKQIPPKFVLTCLTNIFRGDLCHNQPLPVCRRLGLPMADRNRVAARCKCFQFDLGMMDGGDLSQIEIWPI